MAKIDWKTGCPEKDGVYLTTLVFPEGEMWTVLTRFENGKWETAGRITAWDYRPEPYDPSIKDDSPRGCYTDEYVEDLEWRVKDLEATWNEVHGEMKYYEGASEALLNVIETIFKEV